MTKFTVEFKDRPARGPRAIHPGLDVFPASYRCRRCGDFIGLLKEVSTCKCGLWVKSGVGFQFVRFSSRPYVPGEGEVLTP